MVLTDNIQENFPFLTVVVHAKNEYVGIIINQDSAVTSMYDYGSLNTAAEKTKFIALGEVWWWESNRQIPISIFLGADVEEFQYAIKNFTTKDIAVSFGPITRLSDIITKRVKRKSVTLIRKMPR
jgi:hypothetical protein